MSKKGIKKFPFFYDQNLPNYDILNFMKFQYLAALKVLLSVFNAENTEMYHFGEGGGQKL